MKVLLIQPPLKKADKFPYIPLSLLSIASEIEATDGNEVRVLDLNLEAHRRRQIFDKGSLESLSSSLAEFEPDAVGITAYCSNFPIVPTLARHIKNFRPNISIIVGGPHASMVPFEILKAYEEVDIVVAGEGELTCRELFAHNGLVVDNVLGVVYRASDGPLKDNGPRPLADNLDEFKTVDYSLVDMKAYVDRANVLNSSAYCEVGRGCPYNCSFCSTSIMWGRRYRVKSVARVIQEIKELRDEYGVQSFDLLHDHLLADHNYVRSLAEALLAERVDVKWSCSTRMDDLDNELLKLIRKAGCFKLVTGIETGTSRMQKAIGKNLIIEKAYDAFKKCNEEGLNVCASFIVGFPYEQPEDLEATLELALKFRLTGSTALQVHKLLLHPATKFYKENKERLIQCRRTPYFVAWDEDQFHLMKEISLNPEIHPSFFYIPVDYGGEDLLLDIEYIFYVLINSFPRTLLYLTKNKGLTFLALAKAFQGVSDRRDVRYTTEPNQLERTIKQVIGRLELQLEDDSVLSSIVRYEQIVQELQAMGLERAKRSVLNEKERSTDCHLNELVRNESFSYDVKNMLKLVGTEKILLLSRESSIFTYAFVFWRGSVEVYQIYSNELGILNKLPSRATSDQYLEFISKKYRGSYGIKNIMQLFRTAHIIIGNNGL